MSGIEILLLLVVFLAFPRTFDDTLGVFVISGKFSLRFLRISFKTYSWSLRMNFRTRAPKVNPRTAADPLPSSRIDEEEESMPCVKSGFLSSHTQSANSGVVFHSTERKNNQLYPKKKYGLIHTGTCCPSLTRGRQKCRGLVNSQTMASDIQREEGNTVIDKTKISGRETGEKNK